MNDPLAWMPRPLLWTLLIVSTALIFWSAGKMAKVARHDCGVPDVVQGKLELAWTETRVRRHLTEWGEGARQRMYRVLAWDFVFIPGYVALLFTLCALVARASAARDPFAARLGFGLAYAQIAAGLLDVIENIGIYRLLDESRSGLWAPLTSTCASVKWLIVLAAILYVVRGLLRLLDAI